MSQSVTTMRSQPVGWPLDRGSLMVPKNDTLSSITAR